MIQRKMEKCIHILYVFMLIYIILSLVVATGKIDYPCKRIFLFSNLSILVIAGILIIAILAILSWSRIQKFIARIDKIHTKRTVIYGCVLFAALQIYISYNYYFLTDWDADLIYQSARELLNGTFDTCERYGEFCWYYSTYPNNMELLGVFVACLKINQYLGVLDPQNGVMVFVILNCIIMAVTGYLLYSVLESVLSYRWGLAGWIIFIAYIGVSPWVVIPYSDSLGLLFPILELWILVRLRFVQKKLPYLISLGIIGSIGYHLKPQAGIVLIAAIVLFLIEIVCENQKRKEKALCLATILIVFVLAGAIPKAIGNALNIPLDKNREFGATHFVMMGMNPEKRGIYSQEDCDYSHSFNDTASRKNGELSIIKERLAEYGAVGYIKLLNEKLLTTYGDGSFAWGLEGVFWREIPLQKNDGISELVRSFYYRDGEFYGTFLTYMQCFWIAVLFLQLFNKTTKKCGIIPVIELSIIGLTIFELLFESRARYLYIYSPFYIFMAVCGVQNIYSKIKISVTHLGENLT